MFNRYRYKVNTHSNGEKRVTITLGSDPVTLSDSISTQFLETQRTQKDMKCFYDEYKTSR